MGFLDPSYWPLWLNVATFVGGAAIVWLGGTRLSRYADVIASRTGAGQAFVGALLLGGLTSLPEVATTLTATVVGNAALAVNNLFGGVAMQVAILAALDLIVRKHVLSRLVNRSVVMLQGVASALLLVLAAGAMIGGDVGIGWFGASTLLVFAAAIFTLFVAHRYEESERWRPTEETPAPEGEEGVGVGRRERARQREERTRELSGRRLVLFTVLAGIAILVGGFTVARSGEVIAEQTGLGSSFVGAVLVAIATSLPEISTTYAAVLLGNYGMAFSNIFGTNVFDVGILFLADVTYVAGPILAEVGAFAQFAALLGVVVTLVYVAGLLVRSRRSAGRLGLDSLLVLALYLGGVAMLYSLRGEEGTSAPHDARRVEAIEQPGSLSHRLVPVDRVPSAVVRSCRRSQGRS